jgi:hypothetical protein
MLRRIDAPAELRERLHRLLQSEIAGETKA